MIHGIDKKYKECKGYVDGLNISDVVYSAEFRGSSRSSSLVSIQTLKRSKWMDAPYQFFTYSILDQ